MILVTRKLIIKVHFTDFIMVVCIFNKIGFNVFLVIMKGVLIITNLPLFTKKVVSGIKQKKCTTPLNSPYSN